MKKLLMPLILLLALLVSACGNSAAEPENEENTASGAGSETVTYESENGPVEVPADPQRVIVLATFTGNVMNLGVNLVGVDAWSKNNPNFSEELADVEEVSEDNLEKIIELEPDLIIGLSTTKNIDKLQEIAPTVTYTYGKLDYLEQHIEIGKLLNKEEEASSWVADFKERTQQAGSDIKAKIGEDATVTVIENFDKQLYVFGDNWARGTEILYQEMGLKMPDKVKEMALTDGFYALSTEVLPEYVGDYLIVSQEPDGDNSYMETETYKNIPAVKKGQVFEADARAFYFNDPVTLEYQLDFFTDAFLGE